MDGDVQRLAAGLQAALEQQQAALAAKEAELRARAAAVARVEALLAAGDVPVTPSDTVTINVGGTVFTTSRSTLTLVPDSLLGVMFSGRWEANSSAEPPPFLDLDPDLFSAVLSWLRMYGLRGGQQRLLEPDVSEGRKEQFMVLLDFLQLHKHIPVTWGETWCHALHSRAVRVVGTSVTRLEGSPSGARGVDPAHSLSGAQQEQCFSIIGVASSAHSFYDVQVELDLEVVHFGADVDSCLGGPMVIGVMAKSVLDQVLGPKASSSSNSSRRKKDVQNSSSSDSRGSRDQGATPSNADAPATTAATTAAAPDVMDNPEEDGEGGRDPKVTRQPTFYGFFADKHPVDATRSTSTSSSRSRTTERRGETFIIRDGQRSRKAGPRLLWHQGDTLRVTLDCRHHLEYPKLKLLNTVTLDEYSLDCEPPPPKPLTTSAGSSSSSRYRRRAARDRGGNRGPAPAAAPQQQQAQRRQQQQARQGLEAARLLFMLPPELAPRNPGAVVQRQVGNAEQELEQVRQAAIWHMARFAAGDVRANLGQRQQQAGGAAGAAPRAGGQEGPPSPRGRRGAGRGLGGQQVGVNDIAGARQVPPAPAAAQANPAPQQQRQQPVDQAGPAAPAAAAAAEGAAPPAAAPGQTAGEAAAALLPASPFTPQEWVLVVGMARPGDQVRLLSARRVGQHPVASMGH